ncbi:GNAT family N-acetyltransferase [Sulfitobacter sp. W027]|uniref:GNAT family N-acetyltransferase n=1 Tax=Sulfitobacter sp. W027 TaxID=2867025 RepID=UPI0021A943F2|nr:GNAT family N-acetyltransferase [Sulfitobacter sp. W027]UWR32278.1 GNAT family N-acetyltransferase [Sulfitobacter sp. W027]
MKRDDIHYFGGTTLLKTRMLTARDALASDSYLASLTGVAETHPTICPAWLGAYYRAFGNADRDPVLLVQREDGSTAGYLALTRRRGGMGNLSRDLWSTTNGHSQYTALWAQEGEEADVVTAIFETLGRRNDWDRIYLQGLPEFWLDVIRAQVPHYHPAVVHQFENRMVAAGPDAILPEHLPSKKTLRKLRGQMRQLSDQGILQLVKTTDPTELGPTLARYISAERNSWKRQESGELLADDPAVDAFYYDIVAQAGRAFRPTIWTYEYEGDVVAGLLMLENPAEWVMLKVFYHAEYARYSLGRNLLFAAVAAARNDATCIKLDTFSHLAKYDSFASHAECHGDLIGWNGGLRARSLRAAYGGLSRLRAYRLKPSQSLV